jgi:hypothetical protein
VNSQRLDDADIAQLVHDVADGWTMPPVRLDAPTWRERVRNPRARRIDAARGWFGRLGQAATAAVALTVVGALIAVVITRPPDAGKSPAPSDGSTPRATDAARPSPLSKLLANGDLPSPSEVLVRNERGDFAIVSLADGSIGAPLTAGRFGSELQVRTDGTFLCLCLTETTFFGNQPTAATVMLDRLEADGTVISSREIATFTGEPDPRDGGRILPDQPPHVLTSLGFSRGDAFGFVGWSFRADPVWKSGVLVVDLQTGHPVSRLDLPEMTSGDGDARRVVEAPRVVGQDGDALVVGRSWYEFSSPDSQFGAFRSDTEAFTASFRGGNLGDLAAVPGMDGCGDTIRFGGVLPDGGTWVVCTRGGAFQTTVRRVAEGGEILPDVSVTGEEGIEGDATALSRDRSTLFAWDPSSATLTRIALATGEKTTGEGLVARVDGPLAAFGRWLAPVAAAKAQLLSSVIVSPDGSRVYAIGVTDGIDNPELKGSAGVFVFDAATLELIGIYPPTADFVSLAIGFDGRFLYAAGMPGFDALGRRRGDQGASITAFDTTDGSVRVIAGELGGNLIAFGPDPLE